MIVNVDRWVSRVGRHAPEGALEPVVRRALGGRHLALCLHRVCETRRPSDPQPAMTIPPTELDRLISLLLEARGDEGGWLTVTFDDGYEDAARYVESRAPRFPSVEFLLFVCPEKTEARVGFRWDLVEEATRQGKPLTQAMGLMEGGLDLAAENHRLDLHALGERPEYRLADVATLRALQRFPNVSLGNHTNCHFKQTLLSEEQARVEYQRSLESFTRLFGPQRHFAFPFGTPKHQFDERHVRLLRAQGSFLIWTTERRPFDADERRPGGVLPRFPVDGRWDHRQLASWIAARALIYRAWGGARYP